MRGLLGQPRELRDDEQRVHHHDVGAARVGGLTGSVLATTSLANYILDKA